MALTERQPFPLEAVDELRGLVRGGVLLPGETGYDDARRIWNGLIDCYPAIILRAHGANDVMQGVRFAREYDLEIAVKGGGHNVSGSAVCDGGLVLDCAEMQSVRIDPVAKTARVEPGAVLHDFDVEAQAHGLVTPLGFISTTGVAGLTLGGGFGYLSRKWGLTVDNLRSVDLVTATGELVHASETENPALFWAIRGGGGNFGVVTSFEFSLHKLAGPVLCGPIMYDLKDAPAVVRDVVAFMADAPDEVSCLVGLRNAPPAPFLPLAWHGKPVLAVTPIYVGDPDTGEAALAPLRAIGDPIVDAVAPRPYTVFQSLFDAAGLPGVRNYWQSHYFEELTEEAIDSICAHAARISTPESTIGLLTLGGAVADVPTDATPYPHREATWVVNIQSRWNDPETDEAQMDWAQSLSLALEPHATGGVYVNFISERDDETQVRAAYGADTYDRLVDVKTTWDPDNVFHLNQNIPPRT
ncbi:FAD-binding oxidoreductase [Haladaptatus sp. CMSO5]|uniref:FAD-binding oxidoreductase n=1 Tax=Haladaptatus sp. CMSO5 TaxID=3120514 RepID=UPI002FCE1A13